MSDPFKRYQKATLKASKAGADLKAMTAERAAALAEMHASGMSYSQIADKTKLSRSRVQQLVELGR